MGEVVVVPISSLTPSCPVKIRARVFKLWDAKQFGGAAFGANFVLGKDGAIQGYAVAPVFRKLPPWFAEGKVCEFSRFTVDAAREGFRSVGHEYSLVFSKGVFIRALPDDVPVPLYYFEFRRLEDVGTSTLGQGAVLDVLARISAFGPVRNVMSSGMPARVRTVYLVNERGFVIELALWEDFVDLLDAAALVEESKVVPVVVAFSGLQVKKFRVFGLKTFGGTRIFLDPPVLQVSRFRSLLPSSLPAIVIHGDGAVAGRPAGGPFPVVGAPPRRVTLGQLISSDLEGDRFECVVRIVRLNDRFGWTYPACSICYRRARETDDGSFCGHIDCSAYNQAINPITWYKIPVQVSDGDDEA